MYYLDGSVEVEIMQNAMDNDKGIIIISILITGRYIEYS